MKRLALFAAASTVGVLGLAALCLDAFTTSKTADKLALSFIENKPTAEPIAFWFATMTGDREITIDVKEEVEALAQLFRSSGSRIKHDKGFQMVVRFPDGRSTGYTIYSSKGERRGFLVAYPANDGTGDSYAKMVDVDANKLPASLVRKLRAFGLL